MINTVCFWQVRLRNAAKAKIIRWVKPKSKRVDRNAPEMLKTEWAKGNRNAIADLLCKNNFQEDLCLYIFWALSDRSTHTTFTIYNLQPLGRFLGT